MPGPGDAVTSRRGTAERARRQAAGVCETSRVTSDSLDTFYNTGQINLWHKLEQFTEDICQPERCLQQTHWQLPLSSCSSWVQRLPRAYPDISPSCCLCTMAPAPLPVKFVHRLP